MLSPIGAANDSTDCFHRIAFRLSSSCLLFSFAGCQASPNELTPSRIFRRSIWKLIVKISHQELSSLIGGIYDCTLDPSKWEGVLSRIVDVFDSHNAVLTLTDTRYDRLLINR